VNAARATIILRSVVYPHSIFNIDRFYFFDGGVLRTMPRRAGSSCTRQGQQGDAVMPKGKLSSVVLTMLGALGVAEAAAPPSFIKGPVSIKSYDGVSDDLLTAGLGKSGLAGPAPAFVNPAVPTAAELRRNAIYSNYRALVDMTPGGGYGTLYGPNVDLHGNNSLGEGKIAGTEYIAFADDGTGRRNVTLMVQVPASFDRAEPCIITGTSSGSRGVYGAIATSGDWGLKRGCVVAYADKGTGMGVHDLQNNTVNLIDGTRMDADAAGTMSNFTSELGFAERAAFNAATPNRFAFKHAHSRLNPERDWGLHTLQAIEFAFWILNEHYRDHRGVFNSRNTIVIASSVSNGGGAAVRAAELDTIGLIDGVAVSEPNVQPFPIGLFSIRQGNQPAISFPNHSRALFDYTTLINLYQPCASLAAANAGTPLNTPLTAPGSTTDLRPNRCQSLRDKGLLNANDVAGQADEAQQKINAAGMTLEQNVTQPSHYNLNVVQAIVVTYANAYGKFSVKDNLCGFSFGGTDAAGNPAPAPANNVAQIFALGNGIPPTGGINLIYNLSVGGPKLDRAATSPSTGHQDLNVDGALCLRALATGKDPVTGAALTGAMHDQAQRIAQGIHAVRALGTLDKPAIIVHGRADAVLPINQTSRAYVGLNKLVRPFSDRLHYIEVTNAQHLDAFNGLPGYDTRMIPLHVYFVQALNLMYDHLKNGGALPPSQVVHTAPRGGTPGAAPAITPANVPTINPSPATADLITFSGGVLRIPE
jgi:hydroxybutyrate-dimer hydrolase